MDNLFLILGVSVFAISAIAIFKQRRSERRKRRSSYGGTARRFGELSEEKLEYDSADYGGLDLTEEEMEFIDELSDGGLDYEELEEEITEEYENEDSLEQDDDSQDYRDVVAVMYRDGLRPDEIAKKLEMGKREVEIILKVKGLLK